MKRFIYIVFFIFLITSCSEKSNNINDDYKHKVMDTLDNDEKREILEKIRNHKNLGVYRYLTYISDGNRLIQEKIEGKSEEIEFSIVNNNDYYFNNTKEITYANKEKNLYFTEPTKKINKENNENMLFYEELYELKFKKIEIDDSFVTLIFDDGRYSKYDKASLDLLEEKFQSQGNEVINKLEDKNEKVEEEYNKYIKVIENMKKANSVGEVTGNE